MSRIDDLIAEMCPDGVELFQLDEVFEQFSGMTGVSNKWAEEGNCEFIDYMNAYSNLKIDVMDIKLATTKNQNQNSLKKGDILFTSASETPDECAIASEIEDDIKNGVFMDDHLFGLRVKGIYSVRIASGYLKYAFNSNSFRAQVFKAVRGVTRFYISKTDFMKLCIPIPPLPIQEEIVRILDAFTTLEAELEAELEARKKQYEYYRDELICRSSIEKHCTLSDAMIMKAGKSISSTDISDVVTTTHIYPCYGGNGLRGYVNDFSHDGKHVLVGRQGALCGNVKRVSGKFYATEHAVVVQPKLGLNIDWIFYLLTIMNLNQYATKSAQPGLSVGKLEELFISIPPLAEQVRIVEILDRFDALTNDITIGLPAEIEARRKQYEYYRDKLISFKEKVS